MRHVDPAGGAGTGGVCRELKGVTTMSKLRMRGATILAAAALVGCASPARIEQMQSSAPVAVRQAAVNSALRQELAIKDVTGGQDTNPLWVSNVGSADFERALEASLRDAGLLSANRQGGKYQLTAHLLKLEQPLFGASLTVTATVQYTIIERSSGRTVFTQSIATPYTAAFSDAFLGTERLKLANEGAIRTNIARFIETAIGAKLAAIEVLRL